MTTKGVSVGKGVRVGKGVLGGGTGVSVLNGAAAAVRASPAATVSATDCAICWALSIAWVVCPGAHAPTSSIITIRKYMRWDFFILLSPLLFTVIAGRAKPGEANFSHEFGLLSG